MRKMLLFSLFFLLSGSWGALVADESVLEVQLQPVQTLPPTFFRSKDKENGIKYPLKMVKITDNPQIIAPPPVDAIVLYYGHIKLGFPAKEYGVLVDYEAKEKLVWADSGGSGDFSRATPVQIIKSNLESKIKREKDNVYYASAPLTFQVEFTQADHVYRAPIQFDLPYLRISRNSMDDSLNLRTRTWFSGRITLEEEEIYFAVVDTNDNGLYDDAEDLIFVGRDSNSDFTTLKGVSEKSLKTIKSKSKVRYQIDFGGCPEKLILRKWSA